MKDLPLVPESETEPMSRIAGSGQEGYYPNFDLARHLLAVSVLVMHCTTHTGLTVVGDFLAVPFFAVPGFLAISGFLVLQSYHRTNSWPKFIAKRALRILPAFVLSLVFVGILLGPSAIPDALRTWYRLGMPLGTANPPLWSLGWEELFYLLLAVLFSLGVYRRPWAVWALWALSVSAFFVLLFSFRRTVLDIGANLASAFFIGNLAYLYRDKLLRFRKNGFLPLAVLGVAIALYRLRGESLPIQAAYLVLLNVGIVWACVAGTTLLRRRIPDLSYGIYIYHWPVMAALLARGVASPVALTTATLALTSVLAAASWYLVEKPFLSLKRAIR